MTAAAFDTHSFVKSLTAAGMPEVQAEAVTTLVQQARDWDVGALATKIDLAEIRVNLLREIAETRADLLRALAETKADLLKWVIGMIAGAVVINAVTVVGAMLAVARMFGR